MRNLKSILIIFFSLLFLHQNVLAGPEKPVTMLFQAKGMVEYSKDGKKWKKVRRNKFLFEGYLVKTGENGSCKLLNQKTNKTKLLAENSEIEILSNGAKATKGSLTEVSSFGNLLGDLTRKYDEAQRAKYTVVRRAVNKPERIKLSTARSITLCKKYPDLVWENIGPEYSYRLEINDNAYEISSSKEKLVRFSIKNLKPGSHRYCVHVLKDNKIIYSPNKRKRTIVNWLEDDKQIQQGIEAIVKIDSENGFLIGNFLEEQGLFVAAMDEYRKFFNENPQENEMRPFLIKIYNDLKLTSLKQEEIDKYNQMYE